MYDLIGYGDMIADRVRTDAYARALRDAITPGASVLDIGTGTGLFALLACRFGARHVYAVEPSDAIALARDIARANGCADRITFIQKMSQRVTLPEPVDVIVSDIRGILPMCRNSLQSIVDARRRLLAPGGTLIPARDRLMAAPADAPHLYERHVRPWESGSHDLDMTAARDLVRNAWYKGRVRPEELLAPPTCWATLDYASMESAAVSGETGWIVARAGTFFGSSVWFESDIGAAATISNAPGQRELVYGSAYFPTRDPVRVDEGDRIDVRYRADPVGDDYVWSWSTTIRSADGNDQRTISFDQSTFYAMPMVRAQLHKRSAGHRPQLTEDGAIALLVLESMQARQSLDDIAKRLQGRFPARFEDWHAAFEHVCMLSGKFAEAPYEHEAGEEPAAGDDARNRARFSNG